MNGVTEEIRAGTRQMLIWRSMPGFGPFRSAFKAMVVPEPKKIAKRNRRPDVFGCSAITLAQRPILLAQTGPDSDSRVCPKKRYTFVFRCAPIGSRVTTNHATAIPYVVAPASRFRNNCG